jgi:hypothetical protein
LCAGALATAFACAPEPSPSTSTSKPKPGAGTSAASDAGIGVEPGPTLRSARVHYRLVFLPNGAVTLGSPAAPLSIASAIDHRCREAFGPVRWTTAPEAEGVLALADVVQASADALPPTAELVLAGVDPADVDVYRRGSLPPLELNVRSPADRVEATLRAVNAVAACVSQTSGAAVFDPQTGELFSAEAWRRARVEGWSGANPRLASQYTLGVSVDGGGRFRTRTAGLVKLGLPELAVTGHGLAQTRLAAALVRLTALALHGRGDGPPVDRLDVSMRAPRAAAEVDGLARKSGAPGRVIVGLGAATGPADAPLREIDVSALPGETAETRLGAAFRRLFGFDRDDLAPPPSPSTPQPAPLQSPPPSSPDVPTVPVATPSLGPPR